MRSILRVHLQITGCTLHDPSSNVVPNSKGMYHQMLISSARRRGVQNFPEAMIATRDTLLSEVSDHKTGVRAERQYVAEGIANIPPFVMSMLRIAVMLLRDKDDCLNTLFVQYESI